MPKVSNRAENTIFSPTRRFVPLVVAAEKRGIKVLKLNIGDPDLGTPPAMMQAIKKFAGKTIYYAPSSGVAAHVEAWVKYYTSLKIKVGPKNIIPSAGCAEAISWAFLAVADPGDEILVFEPIYAAYKSFATMAGVKLVPVTLSLSNNFALPRLEQIVKKITPKTKAIVIVNPDNPSGKVWSKSEIQTIIKIAKQKNLFIIADETYREIVFGAKPISLLQFPAAKDFVIVLDSASKRFSCPGARIGCLVSNNEQIINSALKFAMARLSAPTLEQYGLIPVLNSSAQYTRKVTQEYRRRRDGALLELKKIPGLTFSQPQGAFYQIIGLPVDDAEKFVEFLLTKFNDQNTTVALTPMKDFYLTPGLGKNEVRLAYVLPVVVLRRAIGILKKAIKAYSN